MMPNEQLFNLSEFAKQTREEVNKLELTYQTKKETTGGETDVDPETDRRNTSGS